MLTNGFSSTTTFGNSKRTIRVIDGLRLLHFQKRVKASYSYYGFAKKKLRLNRLHYIDIGLRFARLVARQVTVYQINTLIVRVQFRSHRNYENLIQKPVW